MISLDVFKQSFSDFKSRQIIYDALEKRALNEHKNTRFYDSEIGSKRKYIFFDDGLDFFDISTPFIAYIVLTKNDLNINEIKDELDADKKAPHYDKLVIICLDDIKNDSSKNNTIMIFGFDYISQIIELSQNELKPTINDETKTTDSSLKRSDEHQKEYYDELTSNSGNCAFVLGNGVSIALGADPWEKMINNLIDYLTPFYIKNAGDINDSLAKSNYLISSFVQKSLFSKCHDDIYYSGIRHCVYRKYHRDMLNSDSLIKSIAKAKIKYPKLRVLTYNYDTFIENQIKKENPSFLIKTVCKNSKWKKDENSIYHLHGFINEAEKGKKDKDCIVLTDDEYFNCYFRKNSWVYSFQKQTLLNRKCLFIGSSMSDIFQLSIINEVATQKKDNWFCYALMCFQGLDEQTKNELIDFYYDKHIKIIYTDTFEQLYERLDQLTGSEKKIQANIQ